MTDVTIEFTGKPAGELFSDLKIGAYFMMRDSLFIKTADGSGHFADPIRDPTSAICLEDGEEWVVDSVERVTIPESVHITVEV